MKLVYPSAGAILAITALVACAPETGEALGTDGQPIIGGTLDFNNDAVVAVFTDQSACTGSIVYVKSGSAYVLTAAHCFGPGPVKYVVQGDNYENPERVMQVVQSKVHPQYSEQDNTFDFAMLKANLAPDSVPYILPMAPAEDKIKVGTAIEHSGYGLTSVPNGATTKRHHVFGKVDQVAVTQIAYDQPNGGPCSGDSGGPGIFETPQGKRIGGVTSYGDQDCAQIGVSGRVSSVYNSFIVPFIGEVPQDGGGSSSATSGAGGSSADATTSAGVGGSGSSGNTTGAGASDGWTAGEQAPEEHSGDIVTKTCSYAPGAGARDASGWWAALALLAFVFGRRR